MRRTADPEMALQNVFMALSEEEKHLLMPATVNAEAREAYAAWLDGRGDPRGEALRLELRLRDEGDANAHARERLTALLADIDPDWWWLMSPTRIQNCGSGRSSTPRVRFRLVCAQEWAALTPTDQPNARRCSACDETVYRCATGAEASDRAARGQCIAVDPSLARDQATDGRALFVGRPDYVAMWAERLFPGG